MPRSWIAGLLSILLLVAPAAGAAQGGAAGPAIAGIAIEFILFAIVLTGVAVLHQRALQVAVGGAITISLYKILFSPFRGGAGMAGWLHHLVHEWVILVNLLLLLLGFALLARHFEDSKAPELLPKILPEGWKGGFVLLLLVWVLSGFLDNIAAAMIGAAVAATVYRRKVHIGFLAAIVAASNAGGAGSVVGDTTTTMMWIAGVSPFEVLEAYIGAAVALVLFGIPAAIQQQRHHRIDRRAAHKVEVDWTRVGVVAFILIAAVAVNVGINTRYNDISDLFPFLGAAVWAAILAAAPLRAPDWGQLPAAFKGAIFLLSLVFCASMMPVEQLPPASWQTAFALGFVSSIFDNIPLTALALKQGGFDWGFLAYAVGFGGSMIWFGSSAGVAVATFFPEAKSVFKWLRHGWYIAVAYVVGFFAMLALIGFHPGTQPRTAVPAAAVVK